MAKMRRLAKYSRHFLALFLASVVSFVFSGFRSDKDSEKFSYEAPDSLTAVVYADTPGSTSDGDGDGDCDDGGDCDGE